METQLKQRLTGAVILVALAVLLVPEILSGPPERRAEPTQIAANTVPAAPSEVATADPSEAGELRSYTIDLSSDGAPMAATEPAAAPEVASGPAANPDTNNSPATDPPESSAPGEAAAAASAASESSSSADAAAAPNRSGAFAVQVGSFGNRENAERLTRELQSKGFPAYVEDPDGSGRGLARVRVGPVATREDASKLLERLRAAGQSGAVVPNS